MLSPDAADVTVPGRDRRRGDVERSSWLVMASDGPALELGQLVADPVVVVDSAARLAAAMVSVRLRLVVLGAPPAGPAEIDLVAAERQRRPSLRVLLINDPDAVDERLRALAGGFDEALPASVTAAELAGRARILAAPRPRSNGRVQVGPGLELDLVASELRRDGVTVHLRPKELRLLTLLATHPGRAYTRRQLLDRIWGQGIETDPRTVDVHVRWLRSKIEPDPERPVSLVTVRGIGYRLDPPER